MHEPAAVTIPDTVVAFARLSGAVDTLCSAIAGFALLAGTRAFTFTALLAWREPVLGGVGLVLLAALGWLRWQCGGRNTGHVAGAAHDTPALHVAPAAHEKRPAINPGNESRAVMRNDLARPLPVGAERAHVACYNRSSESASTRRAARVGRHVSAGAWPNPGAPLKRAQRSLCVTRT
ncbi:hypothetical protein [Paraburkholderia sp. BL21I4N1]|uniref:hypothetical protein n=1 Tax=Paraburkholderia sp. BL21I4N1 TaxID=1938801 RepID=UPI000D47E1CB|nr:hypothetical protein [Paraburkholderia sp. BL21I4N1]PQV54494.1 hypothetical protein B0G83_101676 [Paraburkholderia sp. BL21I4N1]